MKVIKNIKIQLLFNNRWLDIDLENLRKDNIFRLLDENSNLIKDEQGNTERFCVTDAYLNENEQWTIESKPYRIK